MVSQFWPALVVFIITLEPMYRVLGSWGRKGDGKTPLEAVFQNVGAVAHGIIGPGIDVAHLAGVVVLAGDQVAVGSGIDDFGILGIGGDPTAFAAAYVVPILVGDTAGGGAAGDANGGIVLLRAVDVIREILIRCATR